MIVGDDAPNGRPPIPACPINSRQSVSRMNWLGIRYASLLRLPACIGNREADTAGPITSGPCVLFGKEEDTVGDIAAPGDGAQRGGAVETTVDAIAAVTTQCPWHYAGIRFPIGTNQFPGLAHSSPFILRTIWGWKVPSCTLARSFLQVRTCGIEECRENRYGMS